MIYIHSPKKKQSINQSINQSHQQRSTFFTSFPNRFFRPTRNTAEAKARFPPYPLRSSKSSWEASWGPDEPRNSRHPSSKGGGDPSTDFVLFLLCRIRFPSLSSFIFSLVLVSLWSRDYRQLRS
ncbi:hypothetical protein IE53DRAFT_61935 [Violaceomyces palustris]|uniref:Uncharacterized protein n=1 Tax=Violaceomyces palustris TaxID=1673888 RepID=A0ACD0NZG2_9BASI|nr:hypothetical protein IE53DRAFT_61935 [Violaceomyces palustris]